MELEKKIDKSIKILEEKGFDVVYSKKERILSIEKKSMLINGMQQMLITSVGGYGVSFNILSEDFKNGLIIEQQEDNCKIFKIKQSGYIYIDLSKYFSNDVTKKEIEEIKMSIFFLISLHINNILSLEMKQQKLFTV